MTATSHPRETLWHGRTLLSIPAGTEVAYAALMDELRRFQDGVSGSAPPPEVIDEISRALAAFSDRLRDHSVDESRQFSGRLDGVPGRGQALNPPVQFDEVSDLVVSGRVTFGRYYLGANGAVHGGAIPLVFDELLGRLAASGGRPPSRTAYLHVNYRSITPIDAQLRIEGRFDREEGRKRYLTGTIHHGDILCADAEGLFVQLRPGQP